MAGKGREEELKPLADTLAEVIKSMFLEKAEIKLPDPSIERKDIIEYNDRMRIVGMEKFNKATFISCINYYLSEQEKAKDNVLGALVVFIPQEDIAVLIRKLGYPKINDESEDEMKKGCGKIFKDIADAFKNRISSQGYPSLIMSEVDNYRNNVPLGVPFCVKEFDKFELNFTMDGNKILVAEMTMGAAK